MIAEDSKYTHPTTSSQSVCLFTPRQWRNINTSQNPTGFATHLLTASNLMGLDWLKGPHFCWNSDIPQPEKQGIPLDAHDPEVGREISTCAMLTEKHHGLGTKTFTPFSRLSSLQHAIVNLILVVRKFRCRKDQGKLHMSATKSTDPLTS